jgi:hypothetical protein
MQYGLGLGSSLNIFPEFVNRIKEFPFFMKVDAIIKPFDFYPQAEEGIIFQLISFYVMCVKNKRIFQKYLLGRTENCRKFFCYK